MKKFAKVLLFIMILNLLASFAYAGPDDLPDVLPYSNEPNIPIITNN